MSLLPINNWLLARRLDRLEQRIRALELRSHEGHGRGTAEDGPEGSDCPCRTTDESIICGIAGCGFCRTESLKDDR